MTRVIICALSLLVVLSGVACSDESATNNGTTPANNGTTPANNGTTPANNGTTPTNNGTTPTNNGTTPTNNGTTPTNNGTAANNGMADAGTDMTTTDMGAGQDMAISYEGRPLGQCVVDDDCPTNPNGKSCSKLLPGGACLACGGDGSCDDTCFATTCVTTCGSTDECPPGLRCSSTGRCLAVSCTNGSCPVPMFGCNASNFCARIDCSGDPNVCPADTTCTAGVCAEDRLLNGN